MTLSEIKEASFSQLLDKAITVFLYSLEMESVIKKLDIIFVLCRPPRDFAGMEHYRYERDRIVALDNLRHEYVHRGGLGVRLPRGDDDLWYLFKTTNFLLPLVNQLYGIRIDPNHAVAAFGPPNQAVAQNPD